MKSNSGRKIPCVIFSCFAGAAMVAGNVQRQPQPAPNNSFPQWSHDGKKLVFTSDRDGDMELYVMNADGSNVKSYD